MENEKLNERSTVWQCFKDMEFSQKCVSFSSAKDWINGAALYDGDPYITAKTFSGEDLCKISLKSNVEAVINSSIAVKTSWNSLSLQEKQEAYSNFIGIIRKNIRCLVEVESLETGRDLEEVMSCDADSAIKCLTSYQGNADCNDKVVVCVLPQVLSFLNALWSVAPAITNGCSVILLPNEQAVLPSVLLQNLCSQICENLVQTFICDEDSRKKLLDHSDIDMVVVRDGTKQQTQLSTRVVYGTVGKSTMMVFESADLDSAVEAAIKAAKFCHGRGNWSAHRVFVQESIWKQYLKRLKERVIIDDSDEVPQLLIDQHNKVWGSSNLWVLEDAAPCLEVLLNPPALPVIMLMPFRTVKEGLALANNSMYRYYASVWVHDICVAGEVSRGLKFSCVWINCHGQCDDAGYYGDQFDISDFLAKNIKIEELEDSKSLCESEINLAIGSAVKILNAESRSSYSKRKERVYKAAELLLKHRESITDLLNQAKLEGDVTEGWNLLCKMSRRQTNDMISELTLRLHEPLGVIAVILQSCNLISILKLATAAYIMGNSLILLLDSHVAVVKKIAQLLNLPVSVLEASKQSTLLLAKHSDVNDVWTYFVFYDEEYLMKRCSKYKTIWFPFKHIYAN